MIMRPVDDNGDILPVLSAADLLRGAPAIAALVRDRLQLLEGDWWENPSWGNEILEMLKETRYTESDCQALAACISAYILETPGVSEITEEKTTAEGHQFRYTCTVETEDGDHFIMNYEL